MQVMLNSIGRGVPYWGYVRKNEFVRDIGGMKRELCVFLHCR